MTNFPSPSLFGQYLRQWRQRSGLSQLELSSQAGTTPRYLSFIETGRSRPGQDLILRLSAVLNIPLHAQNQLLVLAGLKPVYPQLDLADPSMKSIAVILDKTLQSHEPLPAWVMARGWRILKANKAADYLFPKLCEMTPSELIDLWFGPSHLQSVVDNYAEVVWAGLAGLRQEAIKTGDPETLALLARAQNLIKDIPQPQHLSNIDFPVVCPRFKIEGQVIRTITSVMRFDTAIEITASELRIELMFAADDISETFFKKVAKESKKQKSQA
jgi:transcriptional regulator with XRE-family HTH domain